MHLNTPMILLFPVPAQAAVYLQSITHLNGRVYRPTGNNNLVEPPEHGGPFTLILEAEEVCEITPDKVSTLVHNYEVPMDVFDQNCTLNVTITNKGGVVGEIGSNTVVAGQSADEDDMPIFMTSK